MHLFQVFLWTRRPGFQPGALHMSKPLTLTLRHPLAGLFYYLYKLKMYVGTRLGSIQNKGCMVGNKCMVGINVCLLKTDGLKMVGWKKCTLKKGYVPRKKVILEKRYPGKNASLKKYVIEKM